MRDGDEGPATAAMPVAGTPAEQPAGSAGWLLSNRYRVIGRLGAGSMAEVFRAHDELLGRQVAVKVFRTLPDAGDTLGTQERRQAELQALALMSHPNLITLFDGSLEATDGPMDGSPQHAYLVMELIDGPSLSARLAEGPMSDTEIRVLGTQIADALAYVHARGMVHRDVKPANILIGTDESAFGTTMRARLSDFGIVRIVGSERLTSVDFMVGTATYLAPEQARGTDVGPAADVYALGLVLLEAFTGKRAYEGTPMEAVMARLSRSPEIPRDLPPPWTELLTAMTASDPDARPSAAAVAETLRSNAATTVIPGIAGGVAGAAAAGAAALGLAGAGVAAAAGVPNAHTTVLPALAGDGARGGGAGGGAVAPPGAGRGPGSTDDVNWLDHPDEPRRRRGWIAATIAVVAAAALAISGYFLLHGGSGPSNSPGSSSTPAATTPHRSTSVAHTTAPTTTAPASSSPPTTSTRTTSAPPTTAARTSAPPTTAAPTTDAAPTTSLPLTPTGVTTGGGLGNGNGGTSTSTTVAQGTAGTTPPPG